MIIVEFPSKTKPKLCRVSYDPSGERFFFQVMADGQANAWTEETSWSIHDTRCMKELIEDITSEIANPELLEKELGQITSMLRLAIVMGDYFEILRNRAIAQHSQLAANSKTTH